MTDPLPITPFRNPANAIARIPGSKSLTNRALTFAALCEGRTTLTGALFSEDTEILCAALCALGVDVQENREDCTISVRGCGGHLPNERASLFVGLSGTSARFLTALCAAASNGTYQIDGTARMRERPIQGLFDALASQGAKIRWLGEPGHLPVEIEARGLRGGAVSIDARESSQMLSALLMVAPSAKTPLEVRPRGGVRQPFVEMTVRQAAEFGVAIESRGDVFSAPPGSRYRALDLCPIEPDASAASYFLALPIATGGSVGIPFPLEPSKSLQGDVAFADVLHECGIEVTFSANRLVSRLPPASPPKGINANFGEFSDTFLTLAAVAPLLSGPTRITGIAHTRAQETDRIAGAVAELRRLGQEVTETEDSIEIHPRPLRSGQVIQTYGDHRFAMSFAILGCHDLTGNGTPWLSISNPGCCAKTFPGFFDELEAVRKASHPK